jgi:hypothetical protein
MQRKLLGIIGVDFDATDQLLIIYILCICQILENKWECNEAVFQLFIDFKSANDSFRRKLLYNIPIEFLIPMKLIRLKMCLNETYIRVQVGKRLSDKFPIKKGVEQGENFSLLLFNFT